jgi:homoserine/homoserine lactone efflux protein
MMTGETYSLYLIALAVFFATPPDVSQLLIISNSMRHGLRRSLLTVAGDLTANALQMTAAAFGLAAIVATSSDFFEIVKWLGVAYLAWIGFGYLRRTRRAKDAVSTDTVTAARLFRQGFLTSLSNPYAVVFFAALFPQFIDPDGPIAPQLLLLGGTYILVDGVLLIAWGWIGERAARLLRSDRIGVVDKVCGALMVLAALLLALRDLDVAG